MARAKAIERVIYYLAIPLLIIVAGFRDKPSDYGFTFGDWRQGLKWTGLILLIAAPVLALASRSPAILEYYSRFPGDLSQLIPTAFLDLIGWEFIFRGFLLFGLARLMGPTAVVVQAVPFALAHLGKPELETLSTIFGGTLFGWVAWRSRSFVYPFLIHWFIYTFVVLVAHA
jgi:membrane protease YdiL (CAAX protease family)